MPPKKRKSVIYQPPPPLPTRVQRESGRRTQKPPRYKPPAKFLSEIRHYQKIQDLLIPHAPFGRLVRELTLKVTRQPDLRYQLNAIRALHEAAEAFIVGMFEDSYLIALHAKRITLYEKDMRLAARIRGEHNRY